MLNISCDAVIMQSVIKDPTSRQGIINVKQGLKTDNLFTNDYNINPATTQSINFNKGQLKKAPEAI